MIQSQLALIRRELWEHRAIYVVPVVLALVVSLMSVTGQVAVSASDQAVDIAILGASNLGENERAAALNVLLVATSWIFLMAMGVLVIFYALDALYAERKDKSILFWRSLPVTDAETVVSKLLTAALIIPAITLVFIMLTHIVVMTITSIWVGLRGANAWHIIWQSAPFLDNWAATSIIMLALSLWVSPFIAWFLFVSAFTKRSPFLTAFLPLIVIPMLEKILLDSSLFARMLFERSPFQVPIFKDMTSAGFIFDDTDELHSLAESGVSLMSLLDIPGFLTDAGLWLGLAVCGLLCTAAIYVRRYRDES